MAKNKDSGDPAAEPVTGDPAPPVEVTPDPNDVPTSPGPPATGELPPPAPAPAPIAGTLEAKGDLDPVIVRNHGTAPWIGSDYAPVGNGHVPAGGVGDVCTGVVTKKKALELVAYGNAGLGDGRGPFSIEPGEPE